MDKHKKIISVSVIAIIIVASIGGVLFVTNQSSGSTSHSDVSLQILGNANEDDVIDGEDIEFIQDVIDGKRSESNLTDANNDGVIDQKDIDQVQDIIDHEESILYYVNVDEEVCSVNYPVESMVVTYNLYAEIVYILNATDIVIGVDDTIKKYTSVYSDIAGLPSVGARTTPNVEAILELNPDVFFTGTSATYDNMLEEKLAANGTSIDVIRLASWEYGLVRQGILTLGWILGHEDDAYTYIEWYDNIYDDIVDRVSSIADEDRVSVLICSGSSTKIVTIGLTPYYDSIAAGAINPADEVYSGSYYSTVDMEWIIGTNPDYFIGAVRAGYNGNHSQLEDQLEILESEVNVTIAAQDGNVHIFSYDIQTGPACIIAMAYMAKWFYPDLFADLNPEELHQEYVDLFLKGSVDVSELDSFAL